MCTRIRRSNLVTGLLRTSNGSKARQNAYMSLLKWGVLQSRVVGRMGLTARSLSRLLFLPPLNILSLISQPFAGRARLHALSLPVARSLSLSALLALIT